MASADELARSLVARALQVDVESVPLDAAIESYEKWDSLNHIRIVSEVESVLGRQLETEEVLDVTTLDSITRLLEGRRQ